MMRVLVRILLSLVSVVVLLCASVAFWFFIYSRDLPDVKAMARYAPNQASRLSDPCLGNGLVAIPYDAIGNSLRAGLISAEGDRKGQTGFSVQISRTMFCTPSRTLDRELKEARMASQLTRRFSPSELLTIYANRVSFGENLIGVEAASEYYFDKEPNQLDISEAALLAGIIKGPSHYSPDKHPDRALQRRNEVIDAMVNSHAISADEGTAAKANALSIAKAGR